MSGGPAFPPGGSAEVGHVDEQVFYAVGMAGETPVVLASHASEEEALRLGEEARRGGGREVKLLRAVPAEGEDDALQQYMYGMDGASELTVASPPPSTGG